MEGIHMRHSCLAGWVGTVSLVVAAGGAAHAQSPVNVEKTSNGIEYVSGGVGEDALAQLNERAKDYNLKLVFTLNEGNYLADVDVAVKDSSGRTVVQDLAEGPIFMAKLPAGQYTVAATYEGRTTTRKLKVGKALRTEYLRWPSNPETDMPLAGERDSPAGRTAAGGAPLKPAAPSAAGASKPSIP
jgi:hypothetical protein